MNLSAGLLVLALATPALASDVPPPWSFPTVKLKVGQRLPNFALPTLDSETPVRLYDLLAGKRTLLHIFASW